ncbi:MAG: FecR domain-containing protein [Campylobacterales bacterium]
MKALLLFIASSMMYMSFAAEAAGIFKSVGGDVKIIKNGKNSSTPKVGEKFFESDTIKTGQGGSAGLIFSDDTLVSVGQNAEFTVKEYMFKPGDKKGSFVGKIGKGTIACMTGLIAKMNPESMKVESKTATIGIRGTYFVVEAE